MLVIYNFHNYNSKAVLPIEHSLRACEDEENSEEEEVNMQSYIKGIVSVRDKMFQNAKNKISEAQIRQKEDYAKKHGAPKVCCSYIHTRCI